MSRIVFGASYRCDRDTGQMLLLLHGDLPSTLSVRIRMATDTIYSCKSAVNISSISIDCSVKWIKSYLNMKQLYLFISSDVGWARYFWLWKPKHPKPVVTSCEHVNIILFDNSAQGSTMWLGSPQVSSILVVTPPTAIVHLETAISRPWLY